ncbi:hypothetical protein KM043_005453 [Ampulex compressa]|nr:hypothetical protein KM043_005453 [Ampulex compressa]
MLMPEPEFTLVNNPRCLRRGSSLRIPNSGSTEESELGTQLRRGGSLRISRTSGRENADKNRLRVPSDARSSSSLSTAPDRCAENDTPTRPARHSTPALDAPAPEYLARSLLQLGCPAVSMPTPRSGGGQEPTQSSDSDDYSTSQSTRQTGHGHGHGQGQGQADAYALPKVQVSGPPNPDESSSIVNGSAGSIGARSAPSTPLQVTPGAPQTGQQSISGSQLTVAAANHPQPPRSPSHAALRCNDGHLSKPLSRSTPSMAAGGAQTPAKVSRSSSRSSPTSTSSARQKKFHRHFSQSSKFRDQVAADERVLNYYSCALVGDILLQGHLYITPNYFAFYSNVFGYVTKLLIPTVSVLKISKEKTARIIPNAVAVATEEDRHVFCSLLSRDSTFKLMKQVWDAAMEPRTLPDALPLTSDAKLLTPDALLVDDSEVNPEEDDSSMSESGTDLNSRPPTVCTDTDGLPTNITRPSLPAIRVDPAALPKPLTSCKPGILGSLFVNGLKPGTVITILVALLAALYVSAALMMIRIDRLHTAYLNHPLVSPERFTQDRLLHYLNTNLDQIVKVRQSLQTLSQQFVTMSQSSEPGPAVSGGAMEPEDAPMSRILKMSEEPLVVVAVHMYEKDNATAHRTINYEIVHLDTPNPVLRRGQAFNMALRFNREYVDDTDIVRLLFSFGPNPNSLKGTRGINTVSNRDSYVTDLEAWGVRMIGVSGADLSVEVRSPIDSPVGAWQLNVETNTLGRKKAPNSYNFDRDIYLLFNPWLKDDLVFMEDEQMLDEYVLNDVGKIWVGPWGSARGREWVFGQFDACVLPACQLLLERSGIKAVSRGDPIRMCRAISRIVNSNDDRGVITGRWDGEYSDGQAPAAWTGSVPILEQFLETEEEVKYGQCWVFAGVVTTICRALGIPSRVVSNLVSAHDANASLSVDRYYNIDNEELEYDPHNLEGEDSIWNYHVWNDAWMARPDLPKGYGGWQAIDATPQERSDSFYQCGPASVEAIRQGAVGYNYDVTFMLASVNADLMRWKEDPESELGYSKIDCNKYHIGRMILTKAPWIFDPNGDKDREDITLLYKPKEGTEAERLTLYRAVRSTEVAKKFYALPSPGKEDVEFDLLDLERVDIGKPFSVTVNIKNKSSESRTIQAILSAGSVYYTGVKAHLVKRASGDFIMQPNATEQLRLTVTVDDYLDKLVEYCIMKLYCIATVKETRQTWADEDDFQVLKPSITVKIEGEPVVGKPSTISLSFKNPLKRTLTNCMFNYAGPGLAKNKSLPFREVAPEEEVYVEHQLVPQKSGEQKIIATFTSKELVDITGSASVEVLDENE